MRRFLRFLKDIVVTVLIAVVIALLLKYFVVASCKVLSSSMDPSLTVADRVMAFKLSYSFGEPARGDIIIFKPPAEINEGNDFIKRIIALPGETVEIKNGYVYIDDQALIEPYIAEQPSYTFGPVTVPQDEYFVLGDNRNHSLDGHAWNYPFVPLADIDGKVVFQYYPFNELGLFHYDDVFYPTDPALNPAQ